MTPSPILNINNAILWLKVALSVLTLAVLYFRFRPSVAESIARTHALQTRAALVLVALFSFGVFHNLGSFRGGSFVHYGEMFHYYLGPKYFEELGYDELYNAVIVADSEQGNALAILPFYSDLKTYQNTQREAALRDADKIRRLFSRQRWDEFKADVAFFKKATNLPHSLDFLSFLMDHGYNGSPVSTLLLGSLANAVPVTQLQSLALLDVVLILAMSALVFRTFGFEMGILFSVYFCVNALNAHDYISGSLLRYDWLFCLVAAVCLLEKGRHASSAFFLVLAAMLRVFPGLLLCGIAIKFVQSVVTARTVDRRFVRFAIATAGTGLALFLLPGASSGSVLQPWRDFGTNTALHNSGVYVNHLGLRGIVLFEPSHLSLEEFVATHRTGRTNDIVRNWQDKKELESARKEPLLILASALVLIWLTVTIWKRDEVESLLWPLLLVYAFTFLSHYYYAFLSLFVLLFFRRRDSRSAFVPVCMLLGLNISVLVTDYFGPSPIVFYTLVNGYLFVCFVSIVVFEICHIRQPAMATASSSEPPPVIRRKLPRRRRRKR